MSGAEVMQQAFFDEYKVGGKNRFGRTISEIFAREQGKYVIYTCTDIPEINIDGSTETQERLSKISSPLSKIDSLTVNDIKKYKFINEQIAYAMINAIEGNVEEATLILNNLEKKVIKIRVLNGRIHYLLGSGILPVLCILISLFLALNYNLINDPVRKEIIFIVFVSTFGSIGGFLSISVKMNNLDIDSDSGFFSNFAAGMLRLLIAICGSIFILLVIKSNLLLGVLNDKTTSKYVFFALAFVAGFSETFVPNVINKLEDQALHTKQSIKA